MIFCIKIVYVRAYVPMTIHIRTHDGLHVQRKICARTCKIYCTCSMCSNVCMCSWNLVARATLRGKKTTKNKCSTAASLDNCDQECILTAHEWVGMIQ